MHSKSLALCSPQKVCTAIPAPIEDVKGRKLRWLTEGIECLQNKKVLLIEDEADIREIASLSLESVAGWQVECASGGAEGIRLAKSTGPDAILLDVMMPEMDGPSTLQRLRNDDQTKHIPIIFMTAKVQATDRQRLNELGAEGIISKPFDPMQLADQISKILHW